jgi:tetratricopeptide (TPR) repeat protein
MLAMTRAETGDAQRSADDASTALALSREAGDRVLGAWIMGCYTATRPEYRARPEVRLRHFTDGAFGVGPSDASPRTRAWFATKSADVLAQFGRADECLRELDRAAALCRRRQPIEVRPRHQLLGPDEFWLNAERGACLARLGQTEAARSALDRALHVGHDGFQHVSLWLTLAKARTYAHDGEPEQACVHALDVATRARELNFEALVGEVRHMPACELSPWAMTPAVLDLAERLRTL